ncbi:hypothetical protein [Tautonia plasticadhaerens]|uniref:Uncharacterized protein n=1 Tax=Tautonia plasticadhaerens TaxID=2527974 RepID=A0A518HD85_9BACT|nr:hypothetical protein [Tautonia plasticadhaerens]QDV38817.1 hypothetical protein ElP_67740 [Tautonia plasticadhaerens]
MFSTDDLGTMFSPAKLIGQLLFGTIGLVAFRYGKSQMTWRPVFWGLGLMAFPYAVATTTQLYLVGAALTAGLWFFRE